MEKTEDEIIRKYAKHCGYCNRKTLPPYEYEVTCISCGFNLIRRKHEITKTQRKKYSHQSIKVCRTQNLLYLCRGIKIL